MRKLMIECLILEQNMLHAAFSYIEWIGSIAVDLNSIIFKMSAG